jgi:hypothetical protein
VTLPGVSGLPALAKSAARTKLLTATPPPLEDPLDPACKITLLKRNHHVNMKYGILALPGAAALVASPDSTPHRNSDANCVIPHAVGLAHLRWTERIRLLKTALRVLALVVASLATAVLIDILGNGVSLEAVEHRPAMPTNCPAQNPLSAFDGPFRSEMKSSKQLRHCEFAGWEPLLPSFETFKPESSRP